MSLARRRRACGGRPAAPILRIGERGAHPPPRAAPRPRARPPQRLASRAPRRARPDAGVHGGRGGGRRAHGQPRASRRRRPHGVGRPRDRSRARRPHTRAAAVELAAQLRLPARRDHRGVRQRARARAGECLDRVGGDRAPRRPAGDPRRLDAPRRAHRPRRQRGSSGDPRALRPREPERRGGASVMSSPTCWAPQGCSSRRS